MRTTIACTALLLTAGCSSLDFDKFREASGDAATDGAMDSALDTGGLDDGDVPDAVADGSGPPEVCDGTMTDEDGDGYVDETTLTDTLCGANEACVDGSCADAPQDIEANSFHSCVRTTSGAVYCWGDSSRGQAGVLGEAASPPTRIELEAGIDFVASGLAAGTYHTCAYPRDSRQLHCWGDNATGAVTSRALLAGQTNFATPAVLAGGGALEGAHVALGTEFTLAGTGTTLSAMGSNADERLGASGGDADAGAIVRTSFLAAEMEDLTAGDGHGCAVAGGAVICWGRHTDGQTGPAMSPAPQMVGTGYRAVAAGGLHTCAIRSSDDQLQCWGDNDSGQLGRMTAGDSRMPFDVEGLGRVASVVCGGIHTCALDHEGRVFCWGANGGGQLGQLTPETSTTPLEVPVGEKVLDLSAGLAHTCAVTATRRVVCWGSNVRNQSGTENPMAVAVTPQEVVLPL